MSVEHPLQKCARSTKAILPSETGFIIISAPFGKEDAIADYVSNMDREVAISMLKTLLFRWGINEEWMTKAT